MQHIVYLALGTNLGDRLSNLRVALQSLPPAVQVLTKSRIFETPPWGYTLQPPFLNMAIQAETDLLPAELLSYLKHLETRMGRKKTLHWGPRLIDLDNLFYIRICTKEASCWLRWQTWRPTWNIRCCIAASATC
jgi:2-amino-4-hydroxy-6-hydroxymethyldihydropteridine diphosphokinase